VSITINSVPNFLTREQYCGLTSAVGFDPGDLIELRFAADGVHALVLARMAADGSLSDDGKPRLDPKASGRIPGTDVAPVKFGGYYKHRVFIPIRDEQDDHRTTRIRPVAED
jgi:hypothetical protein